MRIARTSPPLAARPSRAPKPRAQAALPSRAPQLPSVHAQGRERKADERARLSASSVHPLYRDFAHAGVLCAIRRALQSAPALRRLPEWLVLADFESAAAKLAQLPEEKVRRALRIARRAAVVAGAAPEATGGPAADGPPDWAADTEVCSNETTATLACRPPRRAALAALRLWVGAALEALCAASATAAFDPACRPRTAAVRTAAAQVFEDGFRLAVFTSAHADFLEALHAGFTEPAAPSLHGEPPPTHKSPAPFSPLPVCTNRRRRQARQTPSTSAI